MIVKYPESGFANILGQMLEQKLKKEKKIEIAKRMRGRIVLEIRDLKVSATLEFKGDTIEITNGKSERADASISADFETFQRITSKISVFRLLELILSGKLRIKGLSLAIKLGSLMS